MFFQKQCGCVWSVSVLDKKMRFRGWLQAISALLTNFHLPNFFLGKLYRGSGKLVCVPGLNCYSCPAAAGSCPIGALQAVIGDADFHISYYVTGTLILFGTLFGRFICGFLCPFGWFQDLLYRIPCRKFSGKPLMPLRRLKYLVFLIAVLLLPALAVNTLGMGEPFFCKYLCPQGVLEGAIPLSLMDSGIRSALGGLFVWKSVLLMAIILLSVFLYRPFCKYLCPLGAFYALFNKVSFLQIGYHKAACTSCGKCRRACKMGVDITCSQSHPECIRCGDCINACPAAALHFTCGKQKGASLSPKSTGEINKNI